MTLVSKGPRRSVSEEEAIFYYAGLPSNPRLLYRTGTTPWTMPTGLEASRVLKELRPVFGHKLNTVWKVLGPKICDSLDFLGVLWTSIDVVRFITVKEGETVGPVGPVVLWIGVAPKTLSDDDAHTAGHGCQYLFNKFGITDVEVEFRESIYTQSAGPSLLEPVASDHDPLVNVLDPLTPALGLSIAAQATPHIEGTGGLYLAEGSNSKKVLLITARHILFRQNEPNVNYVRTNTSTPRRNVLLLGTEAFNDLVESIDDRIKDRVSVVDIYNRKNEVFQKREAGEDEDDARKATVEREENQKLLDEAEKATELVKEFHKDVTNRWSDPKQRVLGHIVRSPPFTLGAGAQGFTEDYAIVELDSSKFGKAFKGNVIDLGTKISMDEFTSTMRSRANVATIFRDSSDHLLKLRGLIQEDQMREPDMLDRDDVPCLLVIKKGKATGVTIGRATGISSYVRKCFNDGTHQRSTEWSTLPYNNKSGAFSAPGDSGSIIVDSHGRIGGLLTGGAGMTESSDVTYATPFFWLLQRIKANGFPNAHLYPVMA